MACSRDIRDQPAACQPRQSWALTLGDACQHCHRNAGPGAPNSVARGPGRTFSLSTDREKNSNEEFEWRAEGCLRAQQPRTALKHLGGMERAGSCRTSRRRCGSGYPQMGACPRPVRLGLRTGTSRFRQSPESSGDGSGPRRARPG